METALLVVGLLVFVGHLLVEIAKRTRIPDVLVLILIGILMGPYALDLIRPGDLGKTAGFFTTVALVTLLFEGGLRLNFITLRDTFLTAGVLTIATSTVTIGIVAAVSWLELMDWHQAIILGAILAGTSSSVVIPMVGLLKLGEKVRTILILESALTDVLCIVLVYAFSNSFASGELAPKIIIGGIFYSLLIAGAIGLMGGIGWMMIMRRVRQLPNSVFAELAYAFVLYGIAELIGASGAIAALVYGLTLTNFPVNALEGFRFFKQLRLQQITHVQSDMFTEAAFLVKLGFFIYLGISLQFENHNAFLYAALIMGIVYLARYILASTILSASDTTRSDAYIATIMVPKGLVAAVLATRFTDESNLFMRDLAYAVVFVGIIWTSVMIPFYRTGFVQRFYPRFPSDQDGSDPQAGPSTPPADADQPPASGAGNADQRTT